MQASLDKGVCTWMSSHFDRTCWPNREVRWCHEPDAGGLQGADGGLWAAGRARGGRGGTDLMVSKRAMFSYLAPCLLPTPETP